MSFNLFQVDAFTNEPFSGNPAAICFLPAPQEAVWMQQVAAEMNLSETAFLYQKEGCCELRWFTPVSEVDLCGHATLASAHLLWEEGLYQENAPIQFKTKSGFLTATKSENGIEIDLPAEPIHVSETPSDLIQALGVNPLFVGKTSFDFLIEVETEEVLRKIKPDFPLLKTVPTRGVIVTSHASTEGYDFVSRFFAPKFGIDEDPVTGSAHCTLGPFWQDKLSKNEMHAYQASARGGMMTVRPKGNRVFLSGEAVTVLRGKLL